MDKKRIVVFSGAGMSAESGLKTFRDNDGLWEKHRVEDVATPEAWQADPNLVLRFYNERLVDMRKSAPNKAHFDLVKLEQKHDVTVITQNVDDLHERAGSTDVLHLHGQLTKCKSSGSGGYVTEMPAHGISLGDRCPQGHQLRPHIVWFGEAVPEMYRALELIREADIVIAVGTSLNVYPAAGLIYAAKPRTEIILIDPGSFDHTDISHLRHVRKTATEGVAEILKDFI